VSHIIITEAHESVLREGSCSMWSGHIICCCCLAVLLPSVCMVYWCCKAGVWTYVVVLVGVGGQQPSDRHFWR
jgi:hypothetical protein